eukprot:1148400-Pelagomonas_calceolata.AAC.1
MSPQHEDFSDKKKAIQAVGKLPTSNFASAKLPLLAVRLLAARQASYLHSNCLLKEREKRKVCADHRLRALRKGPFTSKLARASPEVPQNYISYN